MSRLRVVFAGTPAFACPALEHLCARGLDPVLVLTQPDRPAGRGRRLQPGPVKQQALDRQLPVFQPQSLKTDESFRILDEIQPDLLVTAAYGLILPPRLLALPRHGCWNLHASLLPRWRGASPIQQAILAGDKETGVCLMEMEAGLDTGPVILSRHTTIGPLETAGELHDRLAPLAGEVLEAGLDALEAGRLPEPRPQDNEQATLAPLIRKTDARINWSGSAEQLVRRIHAYNPWPVAHGELAGEPVRVFRARPAPGGGEPGTVLTGHGSDAVRVACGEGAVDILELQSPGKRRMDAGDWLNARPEWR